MNPENRIPLAPATASINATTIVRSDFDQVRRGGLDPDEVGEHLNRVANYVADLERRISELEAELQHRRLAASPEEAVRNEIYESVGARVADLVRSFDEEMVRTRTSAQTEAETLLAEARVNAERMEREAEQRRAEADRAADDVLRTLASRRSALIEDVKRIHDALQRSAALARSIVQQGEGDVVVVDDASRAPSQGI